MLVYLIDKNNSTIVGLVDFNLLTEQQRVDYNTNYITYELINGIDPTTKFIKPKYIKNTWVECATDEEIKALQEENKVEEKEATEQEKLNAQLLMENAEIKKQLTEQQELTASLLLQIAQLGGNSNV